MISIKTNIKIVNTSLLQKLQIIRDPKPLLRPVAFDVLGLMVGRIHEDGKAADDTQIGTYSPSYMQIRTGSFANSAKNVKGKNKGKNKNAGTATKGGSKGNPREQYHRSNDTKIIVSLTRQLENDWGVMATPDGWGIGFNNPLNGQKLKWVEEKKGKKIGALTKSERAFAIEKLKRLVNQEINK